MNRTKTELCVMCYDQNMFLTLTFDLSQDKKLKSEPFGVDFI